MAFFGSGFFYGTHYYGSDVNSNPPGGIFGMNAYQNVDGTVVLYWRYDPCNANLPLFTWTIDTDLVPTFDSSYFKTYSSVANPDFIDGGTNKGIAVPTYTRQQGVETPMYWRVQGHYAGSDTAFESATFHIPEAIDDLVRQRMLDTLPDVIYKKDFASGNFHIQSLVFDAPLVTGNSFGVVVDGIPMAPVSFVTSNAVTMAAIAAVLAVHPDIGSAVVQPGDSEIVVTSKFKDQRITISGPTVVGGASQAHVAVVQGNTTNVNRIYTAIGKEMDVENLELGFVYLQLFTQSVRDSALNANFAYLLSMSQPSAMKTIDYREIIRAMIREMGGTPTLGSIKKVLNAIYCADPDFILIRDTQDMFVDDPSSVPVVGPFYVDDPSSLPPVLPPTVWDDNNLAFGVIIQINNPLGLTIPVAFIQQIVEMMSPAHAPVYVTGI